MPGQMKLSDASSDSLSCQQVQQVVDRVVVPASHLVDSRRAVDQALRQNADKLTGHQQRVVTAKV